MKICVIGAGYVGLTTTAVLAELGHDVVCLDNDLTKIVQLNRKQIPIYEPGLQELLEKNWERVSFSCKTIKAISQSTVVFIAVGTPPLPGGKADLTFLFSVLDDLAMGIASYKTIIIKSTVPPGTNEMFADMLEKKGIERKNFGIVSNPEFLREGSAVYDLFNADKTVIGLRPDDETSLSVIREMYSGLKAPYILTSLAGAEMIKYANNAFLATKISFINEISRICDAYGVDITDVARGIGSDPRIGAEFLQAGIGFGGSCFPKDLQALRYASMIKNVETKILESVQTVNETQVDFCIGKMNTALPQLAGKKIAVLGIAFKPDTDDTRSSRAVALMDKLCERKCVVHAFDPVAKLPEYLYGRVTQNDTLEEAIDGVDCLAIATDWSEFKNLDWQLVKSKMNGNVVLDCRNAFEPNAVKQFGFHYIGVGRA